MNEEQIIERMAEAMAGDDWDDLPALHQVLMLSHARAAYASLPATAASERAAVVLAATLAERKAVVDWLREDAKKWALSSGRPQAFDYAADTFETGAHIPAPPPTEGE